jgi:tripartite-type tricarboxylate transporter receptor subunit TctC
VRKTIFRCALLFAVGVAPACAQDAYPSRPIRIIVGFAAGGGNDILARLVGQKLSESLGQPVLIENKPGAGSIIAAEFVAKSPPDGYTLFQGASGAMSFNPAVYAKLPYAPLRDFVPVSMVASFPLILIVNPALPVRSVQELVAYAKANPDKTNYASTSASFQLSMELFKAKTGAPMLHVPYKGANEMAQAVITGDATATLVDTGPVAGHLKGGKVRGLAVTSAQRIPAFPDLPTMAEAGVADMEVSLWSGLLAPAGTPPAIVKKLQDEVMRIVRLPDVRERMNALAVDPVGNTSEEFGRIIAAEITQWSAVAKAANIKIER